MFFLVVIGKNLQKISQSSLVAAAGNIATLFKKFFLPGNLLMRLKLFYDFIIDLHSACL